MEEKKERDVILSGTVKVPAHAGFTEDETFCNFVRALNRGQREEKQTDVIGKEKAQ